MLGPSSPVPRLQNVMMATLYNSNVIFIFITVNRMTILD